MQTHFNIAPN